MAEPSVSVDQFTVEDLLNIHQMIYLPSTLDLLISHLEKGIAQGGASPDLCSAVLRLYLLYPQCANAEVVRKILVQNIVALPENQFGYYACISPSHFPAPEDEKRVQDILTLQEHIEACNFRAAWSMLREPDMSDVLHTPGVVDALRRYICEVLQLTFSTISLGDFCLMLNLNSSSSSSSSSNASAAVDEKVEKLIKARGWSIEEGISGGKVVRITPRDADSPKAVATRASVAHKTVEKYLSPEGLQQCLSLLQC
ncbi:eukaryotic translation initiation factor 3 subunit 11, putative [Eimeria acervulina]|uniref:Eukaryotic translation initiation factor 3 subunit 11, putative n=1 Tax=Eimeria acervulina TaxID=5801 RepID=U6GGI3_EIMAC|nr:eukaryotic translation initiation factor 3 subunit 11, putative [Eimeria acervulina]CDI78403.1 eukaryotic translation initiation factor 3 subunit 11, putative [Eimeria acervulina]